MTSSATSYSTRQEQGCQLFVLRSECLEVTVAPELGAKVVSLKDLRTGRDWFAPEAAPRLFRNKPGDDFANSTLFGWDECLPTIQACCWKGRSVPDHGEVWSVPWRVVNVTGDEICLSVDLAVSPLRFVRLLSLGSTTLTARYSLTNLSDAPEQFLWAMHPLVTPRAGDRVELTAEARRQLRDESWLDALDFGSRIPARAKAHFSRLSEGRAAVANARAGCRLGFVWNAAENDALGIWLTRGGWNGRHHLAIEPTNAPADSLADAVARGCRGGLAPHSTEHWTVHLDCESQT